MRRRRRLLRLMAAVASMAALAAVIVVLSPGASADSLITVAPAFSASELNATPTENWLTAGGALHDNRYSALTQIDTTTVKNLKVAWRTRLRIPKKLQATMSQETSPIVYKGVMYLSDGVNAVYALNAATGTLIWKRDSPLAKDFNFLLKVNRGIAIGDGKIYIGQLDGNIAALDQATGKQLWATKVGRWQEGYIITSPVLYLDGRVIAGVSGGDWGARSYAVALDAKTGKQLWKWYVTAGPGEIGGGTWSMKDFFNGGGAIWISPSVDPEAGLLYLVTGNPIPWNGRDPGKNLWTDSIVALHVDTGQFAWGFQTVHHDIWDYDVTNPPVLFEGTYKGVQRKGIAVASKTGWVYILDRLTGQPLIGIEEKKVPQLKGAAAKYANLSKTQPYPIGDAFVNQCAERKYYPKPAPDGKPVKVGCTFTPYAPTTQGSFVASTPQPEGGVDWPMSAYSPDTNYIYLCARDGQGGLIGAIPKNQIKIVPGQLSLGVNFGGGSPILKDYGRIVAIDLATNKVAWSVKWPKPCFSGVMTTAGGLVFAAQSLVAAKKGVTVASPGVLSAYDAKTGKSLWNSAKMPAGPNAPTITYTVDGKQYVAIVAGGNGGEGSKAGDYVYAFALR
jgi:quinohemoprotein ethanol dehydrogenase